MPPLTGSLTNLGDYIREQRNAAKVSLRQLAETAGVSNPYLSQIERGLRKPSADILQQIAKGLRISAETLYVKAGLLTDETGDGQGEGRLGTEAAILGDQHLHERQKQALVDIYRSFCRENAALAAARTEPPHTEGTEGRKPS